MNLNETCAKIAQQTDENNHTGAKITCAKFCLFSDFTKIFQAIEILHNIEGSLPEELSNYRRRKGIEMMQRIKGYYPKSTFDKLTKSF